MSYTCSQCNCRFGSKQDLAKHIEIHKERKTSVKKGLCGNKPRNWQCVDLNHCLQYSFCASR